MKVIMYHYVQSYDFRHPYFKFLDQKDFVRQIEYFGNEFGFISKNSWEKILETGDLGSSSGKVLLTFERLSIGCCTSIKLRLKGYHDEIIPP